MNLRYARLLTGVAVAIGLTGTAVLGQPGASDPLAAARARQSIADQKATAEVDEAIREANLLAPRNAARAAQVRSVVVSVQASRRRATST